MDITIIVAVVFGLLVGSFLNVVIYRLPVMLQREWTAQAREILALPDSPEQSKTFNLMYPPSRCSHCGHAIKAWQNIPVISWLILKGKCHACATPISARYPLIELLTGVVFGVVAWQYSYSHISLWGCLLSAFILAMVCIDADTQLLPDQLTLPLVWLGFLFNLDTQFIPLEQAVWGAIVGYMSLWTLSHAFKLIRGVHGMGYGDFKMLGAIGAWVGLSNLPIIVLFASLVGIVAGIIKRIGNKPMAFGPCLGIAGWLVFLFHQQAGHAISWWLEKSGF